MTSAAKLMFLPPLTTLVTRLMLTTSSLRFIRLPSSLLRVAIACLLSSSVFVPGTPVRGRGLIEPLVKLPELELQPTLACCIGESLDAAVIQIAPTIKDHLLDALLLRAFGDELADFLRGRHVAAGLLALTLLRDRRSRSDGRRGRVVDNLRVDVVERAVDVQAWTLGGAGHLGADALVNTLADCIALRNVDHLRSSFLVASLTFSDVRSYFAPVLPTFFFSFSSE